MCGGRCNESQFESLEDGKKRFAERISANRKLLAKTRVTYESSLQYSTVLSPMDSYEHQKAY